MRFLALRCADLAIPLLTVLPSLAAALSAQTGAPQWIWAGAAKNDQELWFRRTFALTALPKSASLAASCDNHCRIWLNGKEVLRSDTWEAPLRADVTGQL